MSIGSIRLRPLERGHLARTRQWMNDPGLMRLLDRIHTVTEAEHELWFQGLATRVDCRYFAIEQCDGGGHIGNVWLWAIDAKHRRAEVRIVIGDASGTDRGLGPEAIRLIAAEAFERIKLHKIFAYVLSLNPRARRAFEKAGFTLAGVLRADRWAGDRYVDVYLLERLCDDPSE